jgi:hypothetical protein
VQVGVLTSFGAIAFPPTTIERLAFCQNYELRTTNYELRPAKCANRQEEDLRSGMNGEARVPRFYRLTTQPPCDPNHAAILVVRSS